MNILSAGLKTRFVKMFAGQWNALNRVQGLFWVPAILSLLGVIMIIIWRCWMNIGKGVIIDLVTVKKILVIFNNKPKYRKKYEYNGRHSLPQKHSEIY